MDEEGAAGRLHEVRHRMARVLESSGRAPGAARLIAVSKTFDAAAIAPVLTAGQRDFGENRVQEAQGKWPGLRARYPDLALHLIGPLQSNKTREAVALFDCIHSVDRPKIAESLAAELARTGKTMSLFVQVNTGEEPQKAGIAPAGADAFIARCRDELGLAIAGLMCIPPADEPPSPHFALLAKIAARNGLSGLSMGMSGDFEQALMLGATHVRVGSAIFGGR
jgi:pyridoxal phosphate enzyme (YggS family)